MRRIFYGLLAVPAVGGFAAADTAADTRAAIIAYGVNCQIVVQDIVRDQDTIDGDVILSGRKKPWEYDAQTFFVPMATDISFGFSFVMTAANGAPLTATITHPPMGEDGKTRQTWQMTSPPEGSGSGIGYALEDGFELVEGRWHVELSQEETVLAAVVFELVPPDRAAEYLAACPPPVPTS
ncbi:MAG: DUF3859 domain-containing protein [Pseudomonadota bacterium]